MLSAYRIVWFFALFDLPVKTKTQRRNAQRFRLSLLDMGFSMVQYSVYARPCGRESAETLLGQIRRKMPDRGRIAVLTITDRQYGAMSFFNNMIEGRAKIPEQYTLF